MIGSACPPLSQSVAIGEAGPLGENEAGRARPAARKAGWVAPGCLGASRVEGGVPGRGRCGRAVGGFSSLSMRSCIKRLRKDILWC